MGNVLHKVRSQWAVLGVMGATVVALGTMNVPQAVAAELDGVTVTEAIFVKILSATAVDYDAINGRVRNNRVQRGLFECGCFGQSRTGGG
jgi:hypothetical protein